MERTESISRPGEALSEPPTPATEVKTAVAGRDPNWGRIIAAAGRSGVALEPEEVGGTAHRRAGNTSAANRSIWSAVVV